MKKIFLLAAMTTVLFACKKEDKEDQTYKGATVQLHDGKAWSSITLGRDGKPRQLAITITEAALNSLPEGNGGPGHDHEDNIEVPLHPKALASTPFKFIGLDWAPSGHPPAGVYTLPHFDFHFYMVTPAEVAATIDMAKMMILPAADYMPANYVPGNPTPQMGLHWIDLTSPELDPDDPQTFTETFIIGTYNGKVTFYEPMITLDFLKSTNTFSRAVPQAEKVQQTGYYPTQMRVVKRSGETSLILESFVLRQAS